MAGFLYFVEESNGKLPDGLRYAFESAVTPREATRGPEGKPGCVFANHTFANAPQTIGYFPDRQTWIRQPRVPSAFVGFFKSHIPTEQELRRSRMLPGRELTLGNGESWTIPIARSWNSKGRYVVRLPSRIGLNKDGKLCTTTVIEKYQELWQTAQKLWDAMYAGTDGLEANDSITMQIEFDQCVAPLAANYLVSDVEIGILELLDTENIFDIADVVLDLAAMFDIKKKQAADTCNLQDGNAA